MRIAILGGTFDPIHNGHLAAARSVAETFQVDEVHFVPAFSPPHKQSRGITSPFHRFAMVALATASFDGFRTSTVEVDALERRYTVETLAAMQDSNPEAELLFIIGTDMYQEIETWKDYRRLFELAHLVIVNRPGFSFREDVAAFQILNESPGAENGKWTDKHSVTLPRNTVFYLPFVKQPISSTEIRDERKRESRLASGCRRWSGITLSATNFILNQAYAKPGEQKDQLMDKENQLAEAIEAALDKKAEDAVVLELADVCSFTDYFLICTATSTRHSQAIAEHIEETLKKDGLRPLHVEGHTEGEWILLDYFDFVVHIFSTRAREFYDLERLWRAGKRRDAHELIGQRAL